MGIGVQSGPLCGGSTGACFVQEAEFGMLVVETIEKIRHAYFVQQKPIKEICRELQISRGFHAVTAAVSKTCLIRFDGNSIATTLKTF